MHINNGNFEQKLLSIRTLPVVVLTMNPSIDDSIAPIGEDSQTLLMPMTKEVVADAACGGAWVNRNPWQVSRTGVDRSTRGNVCNSVSVEHASSPVLIRSLTTPQRCFHRGNLQIA